MNVSPLIRSFLVCHMVSTWTHLAGRHVFMRHARRLSTFRPLAEPLLVALIMVHGVQGVRRLWRYPQRTRALSAGTLAAFLVYHVATLRASKGGEERLYDNVRTGVTRDWFLYEAGLLALAFHLRSPWIPLGFAVVPLVHCWQTERTELILPATHGEGTD